MKTLKELREEQNLYLGDYGEYLVDCNCGYICDCISELADNHVDIYNYNLLEWVKDNSSYVEDAVAEFGIDSKNFDFFGLLRQGQYLQIEEELHNNLDDILTNWIINYIEHDLEIKELTDEQVEQVEDLFDKYDNNDELEYIIEKIEEIFENKED